MATRFRSFLPASFLLFFGLASGHARAEETRMTLSWKGRTRSCRLLVPPRRSKNPMPLVMALHGTGQRGEDMARLLRDDFDRLARRDGVIVAYPDSLGRRWNDGRDAPGLESRDVDDTAFLCDLADEIARRHGADRPFAVAGFSNGGMMALRLALAHPERIRAVAAVAALLPRSLIPEVLDAPKPVPAIFFLGTKDPFLPWGGGRHGADGSPLVSKRDLLAHFVRRNEASSLPRIDWLPDPSEDGCRVRREIYGPTRASAAAVIFYGVIGGGHTWPGGHPYLSSPRFGPTCRDLSATTRIWDFFRGQNRRLHRAGAQRARPWSDRLRHERPREDRRQDGASDRGGS